MTSGEVNKQHIFDTKNKITQLGLNNSSAKMLPKQSVMMALSGKGKTKGTVATLEVPSCCSQSVAAFVCDKTKINYMFLYYYFKSIYKSIRGLVGDNKRDGLSLTIIGDIPLVLPSLSEQTEIVEYLNEEISKIEDITKKVQSQIELLEEYKQSLIYHVVTGKVDVHEVEV